MRRTANGGCGCNGPKSANELMLTQAADDFNVSPWSLRHAAALGLGGCRAPVGDYLKRGLMLVRGSDHPQRAQP